MVEDSPYFWPVEEALSQAYQYTLGLGLGIRNGIESSDEELHHLAKIQARIGISPTTVMDHLTGDPLYSVNLYGDVTIDTGRDYYVRGFGMVFNRYPATDVSAPNTMLLVTNPRNFSEIRLVAQGWDPDESAVTRRSMIIEDGKLTIIAQRTRRNVLFDGPASKSPDLVTPHQAFILSLKWNPDGHLASWGSVLTLDGEEEDDEVHRVISSHGPIFTVGTNIKNYHLPQTISAVKAIGNILDNKPARQDAW